MITQIQINKIIKKVVENYQPEKIILFGSYAQGSANEDSDIDLCIIKNTKENFIKRSLNVRLILRPITIPVDVIIFTPQEFAKKTINHIAFFANKYGKTVYENLHKGLA